MVIHNPVRFIISFTFDVVAKSEILPLLLIMTPSQVQAHSNPQCPLDLSSKLIGFV